MLHSSRPIYRRPQFLFHASNAATGLFIIASFVLASAATLHLFLGCIGIFLLVVGGTELLTQRILKAPVIYLVWMTMVATSVLVSCSYSPDPSWSFKASRNLAFFLFCSYIVYIYIRQIEDLDRVLHYIWIAGIVLGLTLTASYVTGTRHATEHRQGVEYSERISRSHDDGSPSGLNPNTAGLFCGLAFVCGVYFVEGRRRKFVYAILTVPIAAGILLSASRGAIVFALTALIILVLTIHDKRRRLLAVLFAFFLGVTFFVVAFSVPQVSEWTYTTFGHRFVGDSSAAQKSVSARKEFFDSTMQLITERPLMGHGIGSFQYLMGDGQFTDSNYLEFLAGVGVLGAAAFYSIYMYAIFFLCKGVVRGDWHARLLFTLLVCLLTSDFWIITAWYTPVLVVLATATAYVSRVCPYRRPRPLET